MVLGVPRAQLGKIFDKRCPICARLGEAYLGLLEALAPQEGLHGSVDAPQQGGVDVVGVDLVARQEEHVRAGAFEGLRGALGDAL
jgi:hypothetical protein